MNLSADIGEGMPTDDELLGYLDSASICCGDYAGSPAIMAEAVRRCLELNREVGAHPGYADPANFGRVETGLSAAGIETLIRTRVTAMAELAPVAYIKPHGALYHRCQSDPEAAAALCRVASDLGAAVVGQPGLGILAAARGFGIRAYREGFADRAYRRNGELVSRDRPNAVLRPDEAAAQALALATSGAYDTVCIHGDSPGAVAVARAVRASLSRIDLPTGPLRK